MALERGGLLEGELDAVMENRVHDTIKRHECASEKLDVMKGDMDMHGKWHENHNGGRSPLKSEVRWGRSQRQRGWWDTVEGCC